MATFPAVICQPGGEGEERGLAEEALWSHLFFLRGGKRKVEAAQVTEALLRPVLSGKQFYRLY